MAKWGRTKEEKRKTVVMGQGVHRLAQLSWGCTLTTLPLPLMNTPQTLDPNLPRCNGGLTNLNTRVLFRLIPVQATLFGGIGQFP